MLALGLLGAASAGCGAAAPAAPADSGRAGTAPVAPSAGPRAGQPASPARSGGRSPPGLMGWQRFCAAPPGAGLRAALLRPVTASLQDEVVPLGSSGDGRT